MLIDYYKILCVNPDASAEQIKLAYRKLALDWHPDRHHTLPPHIRAIAEQKFKEATEAYDVLGSADNRREYDRRYAAELQAAEKERLLQQVDEAAGRSDWAKAVELAAGLHGRFPADEELSELYATLSYEYACAAAAANDRDTAIKYLNVVFRVSRSPDLRNRARADLAVLSVTVEEEPVVAAGRPAPEAAAAPTSAVSGSHTFASARHPLKKQSIQILWATLALLCVLYYVAHKIHTSQSRSPAQTGGRAPAVSHQAAPGPTASQQQTRAQSPNLLADGAHAGTDEAAILRFFESAVANGDEAMRAEQWRAAAASYQQALTQVKDRPALVSRVRTDMDRVSTQLAEATYRDAMARTRQFVASSDWRQARSSIAEALAVKPGDVVAEKLLAEVESRSAQERFGTLVQNAHQWEAQEQWDKAESSYIAALRIREDPQVTQLLHDVQPKACDQRYRAAMAAGRGALAAGDWASAKTSFNLALAESPRDPDAISGLRKVDDGESAGRIYAHAVDLLKPYRSNRDGTYGWRDDVPDRIPDTTLAEVHEQLMQAYGLCPEIGATLETMEKVRFPSSRLDTIAEVVAKESNRDLLMAIAKSLTIGERVNRDGTLGDSDNSTGSISEGRLFAIHSILWRAYQLRSGDENILHVISVIRYPTNDLKGFGRRMARENDAALCFAFAKSLLVDEHKKFNGAYRDVPDERLFAVRSALKRTLTLDPDRHEALSLLEMVNADPIKALQDQRDDLSRTLTRVEDDIADARHQLADLAKDSAQDALKGNTKTAVRSAQRVADATTQLRELEGHRDTLREGIGDIDSQLNKLQWKPKALQSAADPVHDTAATSAPQSETPPTNLDVAQLALKRRQLEAALQSFELALKDDPQSAEAKAGIDEAIDLMYRQASAQIESTPLHRDLSGALRLLSLASDHGHPGAQAALGVLYLKGIGVKQDYDRARSLLQQSATQGDPVAQGSLGWMAAEGLGRTRDYEEAARWYQLSAHQGNRESKLNLARMYQEGKGVPRDPVAAEQLFQQVAQAYLQDAKAGKPNAQFMMGSLYESGNGVPRDMTQAIVWYRRAGEQGDKSSQIKLGYIYSAGIGVAADQEQAKYWTAKAGEHSDDASE